MFFARCAGVLVVVKICTAHTLYCGLILHREGTQVEQELGLSISAENLSRRLLAYSCTMYDGRYDNLTGKKSIPGALLHAKGTCVYLDNAVINQTSDSFLLFV
jgi:hypothetical protein